MIKQLKANLPHEDKLAFLHNNTMSRTIYFTKNDKLAMLKVMIDISNHYSERLPHAAQIIKRKSETLLELSNGVEEANDMSLTEALDIVNNFKHDENKIDFIKELLAEILLYTHYGALHKYETSDYLDEEGNYDNEYDLIETFRDEWRYIYLRLRELIAVINEDDFTAELISWRCVRMHYEDWVVLEERPNNHR